MFTVTSLAVLVRILVNPLANVYQKQLTQRALDPLVVTCATYGGLTLLCLPALPWLLPLPQQAGFWRPMLLTGLLAVFGNVLLVKALQQGNLSVLGPINAYKAVVGLLASFVLLNEQPGRWGMLGVALIVAGSYVVLLPPRTAGPLSWAQVNQPAVRLRLAALVFSAIDGVVLKQAILASTPAVAFFGWCLLGFLCSFIGLLLAKGTQLSWQWGTLLLHRKTLLLLCLSVGLTQLTSNLVLQTMPVGYALSLFQLSALVSVLLGYRFFQEQAIPRKLAGAGIMVIGAVVITLFG